MPRLDTAGSSVGGGWTHGGQRAPSRAGHSRRRDWASEPPGGGPCEGLSHPPEVSSGRTELLRLLPAPVQGGGRVCWGRLEEGTPSLKRPGDTSPSATVWESLQHFVTGLEPTPHRAHPGLRSALPPGLSPGVHCGRHPSTGCGARLSWANLALTQRTSWQAPQPTVGPCPAGTSRSCTGISSTWPPSQTPTRTCSPCSLP